MLPETTAIDPYRSPVLPAMEAVTSSKGGRPTGLTVICVLCIVLGSLGLMNSLLGTVGAAAGPWMQKNLQPKSGPPELQKVQSKFQDEAAAVQTKYFTPLVLGLAFRFLAALLLLIGGIRTLSLQENGRKMLIAACVVALAFELAHSVLQSFMMLEMMTAFNSLMRGVMEVAPDGKKMPAGVAKTIGTVMQAVVVAQFLAIFGLVALKGGLYIFSFFYLQKQRIMALFQPA
jgi:hypothetical protein